MTTLGSFKKVADKMEEQDERMPVLFIGHGSPMNAIEDNEFSRGWKKIADSLPRPKAILCISAHWETRGTFVTAMEKPRTIHDFGGFPKALFDVQYPAPGDPLLAKDTIKSVHSTIIEEDLRWGLDHGSWSVIKQMYPDASIPVVELSLDINKNADSHFALGSQLEPLRKKGILVIGSGNMVHNLGMVNWSMMDGGGYDWALEANEIFKNLILQNNTKNLIDYRSLGKSVNLAIPTPEHYLPMLYSLALKGEKEKITLFNDKAVGGSLTMTSVLIS